MGKKRNKKAIVITAILMLAGVLLVLTGFFGGWFVGLFNKDFDFRNIKPEDVGQEIKTDIKVYYEPTELLASYDMQSDLGATYHLFITDKTGKYVVVEWLDGEMVVVEHPCCTNSVIAPGAHYNEGLVDDRLPTIENSLGNDRIVTEKEAMEILEKVKDNQITEWSCVYNLDDFTVSICLDGDYTKVYTFRAEELR